MPPMLIVVSIFWLTMGALRSLGFSRRYFSSAGLAAESQCRQRIHYQIDPEYLGDGERLIDADKGGDKVYGYRREIDSELKDDKFTNRIVNSASVQNSLLDA